MRMFKTLDNLGLPPEERILLEAIRSAGGFSERVTQAARAVTDWPYVMQLAQAHRIGALLGQVLKQVDYPCDADIQAQLSALAQVEFGMSLVNRVLRRDAVTMLNEDGITPLLLKGSAMDQLVYPSDTPRTMSDVDILLHKDEIEKASECLAVQGFKQKDHTSEGKTQYHLQLVNHGRIIELHWNVIYLQPFYFNINALMKRSQPVNMDNGLVCRAPGYVDLFIQAAFHWVFVNRFYSGLQALLDIVLLWTHHRNEINNAELIKIARQTRTTGAVYWALEVLSSWLGFEVEKNLLDALRLPGWLVRSGVEEVERSFVHSLSHLGKRVELPDNISWMRWHLVCTSAGMLTVAIPTMCYHLLRAPRGDTGVQHLQTPWQRICFVLRRERWVKLWRLLRQR